MKYLFFITVLGLSSLLYAQDRKQPANGALAAKTNAAPASINWSDMVNRDFVCIWNQTQATFDLNAIATGLIVRVRYYGDGMTPLINPSRDGGKLLPFTKSKDSRIIEVRGLSDGGIGVIMATADREGPFIETIMLTGFYNYTFRIQGLVQPENSKMTEK